MFLEKYVLNKEVISIENDYIKQFESKPENKDYYLLLENIKYEKFNFLRDIFEYCEIKNLNCVHANGPIIKNFCENISFQPYLDEIYKQFDLLNINYTKKVFCLENDEYGDSISHVNPSKKKIFTKKYFEILQ